jgi:molybdate transport system regulatory protein
VLCEKGGATLATPDVVAVSPQWAPLADPGSTPDYSAGGGQTAGAAVATLPSPPCRHPVMPSAPSPSVCTAGAPTAPATATRLRLRLLLAPGLPLGPGKADLLTAIAATGSMAAAARQLGMSYQRAHTLVASLNSHFAQPVVAPAKGGVQGGGSLLTPFGHDLLTRYRAVLAAAETSAAPHLAWMDEHRAAGNDGITPR